jgi:hypothetical protein
MAKLEILAKQHERSKSSIASLFFEQGLMHLIDNPAEAELLLGKKLN